MVSRASKVVEYRVTLKAARINAKISQTMAAMELNINKSTLSKYENGITSPDWEMLNKMKTLYNMPSLDYFQL